MARGGKARAPRAPAGAAVPPRSRVRRVRVSVLAPAAGIIRCTTATGLARLKPSAEAAAAAQVLATAGAVAVRRAHEALVHRERVERRQQQQVEQAERRERPEHGVLVLHLGEGVDDLRGHGGVQVEASDHEADERHHEARGHRRDGRHRLAQAAQYRGQPRPQPPRPATT